MLSEVLVEANYLVLEDGFSLDPAGVTGLQPALIVLDIPSSATSPELDYVAHLKSVDVTARIPILGLCKTYPSEDVPAWIQQNRLAGLLRKPFELDEFVDVIQKSIESAASQR